MLYGRGFTLIELIITIAIVGILSAIAYPTYTSYVVESKRADAHRSLAKIASLQERWYSQFHRYSHDTSSLGVTESEDGHYTIKTVLGVQTYISDCNAVASEMTKSGEYTVMAIPTGQQQKDAECSCIFMTSNGMKSSTGTRNDPKDCW